MNTSPQLHWMKDCRSLREKAPKYLETSKFEFYNVRDSDSKGKWKID